MFYRGVKKQTEKMAKDTLKLVQDGSMSTARMEYAAKAKTHKQVKELTDIFTHIFSSIGSQAF